MQVAGPDPPSPPVRFLLGDYIVSLSPPFSLRLSLSTKFSLWNLFRIREYY
jgi:hypothetical protein